MKKENIYETVCYDGLNSIPEVLESCMEKYSAYKAITDRYNNIYMTYRDLKEEMNLIFIMISEGLKIIDLNQMKIIRKIKEISNIMDFPFLSKRNIFVGILKEKSKYLKNGSQSVSHSLVIEL